MMMPLHRCIKKAVSALLLMQVITLLASCTTTSESATPRRQIDSCPPGFLLICTSGTQEKPSDADSDEIPDYDFCRCQPDNM